MTKQHLEGTTLSKKSNLTDYKMTGLWRWDQQVVYGVEDGAGKKRGEVAVARGVTRRGSVWGRAGGYTNWHVTTSTHKGTCVKWLQWNKQGLCDVRVLVHVLYQ